MTIGWFVLVLSLVVFGGLRVGSMKPMMFRALKLTENHKNNLIISIGYCLIIVLIAAT